MLYPAKIDCLFAKVWGGMLLFLKMADTATDDWDKLHEDIFCVTKS